MKLTKIILVILILSLIRQYSTAQTGQWKLSGNSLSGSQSLGSTNDFPVNFITNNLTRLSLTNTGNLKIVSDQSSIQFPNPGAAPKPMMYLYESGSANTSRMVVAYSPSFPTYGLQYNLGDRFDFLGSGVSVLDIDLAGKKVGIGTISPKSKLHVANGLSGAFPTFNTTLTLENNTHNYISLLTPNGSESGILFGSPASNANGGIVYNSTLSSSPINSLQFRTNGNIARMVLTGDGKLRLGKTLNPGDYRLRIDDSEFGLDIANSARSTDWEFLAELNLLELFGNGDFKGSFNMRDGSYNTISDERLKTDIRPMAPVLEKIRQLKPISYRFKNTADPQQFDGLLAQDVLKVFPSLVMHNINAQRKLDVYALNYSGFGVVAVRGIQELLIINEGLKKENAGIRSEIENLKTEIGDLKAMLLNGNVAETIPGKQQSVSLTVASLGQNIPNPFTNATAIAYTLPKKFSSARIVITDNAGKIIKQVNISGAGKGSVNVDASLLPPGAYLYALIIDGKTIDSKQMVVAK